MRKRLLGFVLFGLLAACSRKDAPSTEKAALGSAAPSAVATVTEPVLTPAEKADRMTLAAEFGKLNVPENNPQSDAKIALGNELFFDARLSVDGSRSCYSCHQNEDGNGGKDPLAIGAKNQKLPRHSPVIWNVAYLSKLYWDGRSDSLEAQAKGAWGGGNMGVGKDKLEDKAKEIAKLPGYKAKFDKAFPGKEINADRVAEALSAYERTLVCNDTAYDRYARGNKAALSDTQKQGLVLFMGKAGCAACHNPPFFSSAYLSGSGSFFNVGIGTADRKEEEVDVGRMSVSKSELDWAAFKPPGLRNVSKSGPYFHDGSAKTLEEAVRTMASGGIKNKNLSGILVDRKLDAGEISAIVAFLGALDCNLKLEPPLQALNKTAPSGKKG